MSGVAIGNNNKRLYDKREVNIEILNVSSQDGLLKIGVTIELNNNMRELQYSISASTSVPLKRLGRQVLFDLQNMLREEEIKSNEHVTH
ncbi:hypothetical protein B4117_0132 [Bacillus mycoides]|nr:hypothetical protein B4117_0132 [Bacillus mycoides]